MNELDDLFGWALGSANFGAGSRADLAVGVPGEGIAAAAHAGAVNVLYGSTNGLSASGEQFWHQDSPGVMDTAEADDFFSTALVR